MPACAEHQVGRRLVQPRVPNTSKELHLVRSRQQHMAATTQPHIDHRSIMRP